MASGWGQRIAPLLLALLTTCLGLGGAACGGKPVSCTDGIQNGSETGIDCGGTCVPCDLGMGCSTPKDCKSLVCTEAVCSMPPNATCSDGIHNGIETDVDCGGGCPACANGKICRGFSDCASVVCSEGRCTPPSCTDKAKNGNESDIDCGGSCGACGEGKACTKAQDCGSLVCPPASLQCAAPTCSDGVANASETDVDCGGACDPCAVGKACREARDCTTGVCPAIGRCPAPSCTDTVRNGSETHIDCGGSCGPCADGKSCLVGKDCSNGICTSNACVPARCDDGVKNGVEVDADCGGNCGTCADGKLCVAARDCASGVCMGTKCAVPSCIDGVKNGRETDLDCGADCNSCLETRTCEVSTDCRGSVCGVGKRCQAMSALVPQPDAAIARRAIVKDAQGVLHSVLAIGNTLVHLRRTGNVVSEQVITTIAPPELPFHGFFHGLGGAMYRLAINSKGRLFLLYATTRGPAARDSDIPYLTTYTSETGWSKPVDLRTAGLLPKINAEYHEGFDLAVDSQDNLHVVVAFFPYSGLGFLESYRWDPTAVMLLAQVRLHTGWVGRPTLVVDEDDHLHLAYDEYYANSPIHYRASTDGGLTWAAAVKVANRTSAADTSIGLAITKGAATKVRFVSRRAANRELEIFSSADGTAFAAVHTTNEPSLEHESSHIVAVGNRLHVVYLGREMASGARSRLYRIVSTDVGFGPTQRLDDSTVYGTSTFSPVGSTWPAFNRPATLQLIKHWSAIGITPPPRVVLINQF